MITDIIEVVCGVAAGGGATLLFKRLFRKKKSTPSKAIVKDAFGAWPWLWEDYYVVVDLKNINYTGFRCPKCRSLTSNVKQPKICNDENHYYNEHYHFVCSDCDYTAIMRSYDDKG